MNTTTRFTVAAVALCMAWVFAGSVSANPKMGKDSGKPCAACHTTAGKPDLNDFGKCYKDKKDVAACEKK